MSKPTTGEWTLAGLMDMVDAPEHPDWYSALTKIADAHNAALAADRKDHTERVNSLTDFYSPAVTGASISAENVIQQLRAQLAAEREKPYPRFKCLICRKGANELATPHYLERVSATGKGAPALWLCTDHLNYDMRQKWIELCDKTSDNETKAAARAEQAQIENQQLREQLAAEREKVKEL